MGKSSYNSCQKQQALKRAIEPININVQYGLGINSLLKTPCISRKWFSKLLVTKNSILSRAKQASYDNVIALQQLEPKNNINELLLSALSGYHTKLRHLYRYKGTRENETREKPTAYPLKAFPNLHSTHSYIRAVTCSSEDNSIRGGGPHC